jgi:hypothetical protein
MPKWNLFEDCGISSSIFPPVSIEPSEVKIDCKCTELGDQIKMEIMYIQNNLGSSTTERAAQNPPAGGLQQQEYRVSTFYPQVEVRAIVGGSVNQINTNTIILETTFFEDLANSPRLELEWFKNNWIQIGRVPKSIIYENVEIDPSCNEGCSVIAGGLIGKSSAPFFSISIKYADGKFMNPIEFLSLLLWKEECDPVYRDSPAQYQYPLLQKMMTSKKDGSEGNWKDDDWIGLKPPLRTYKRVEYEARKELSIYKNNWKTSGDISSRIKNPKIIRSGTRRGYVGDSKCNILAGELAFRAGFRVFVKPAERYPEQLKYKGPDELVRLGRRDVEPSQIDREISEKGKVFIFARKRYCEDGSMPHPENGVYKCNNGARAKIGHVVILSSIEGISTYSSGTKNYINGRVIDQHCNGEPRETSGNKIYYDWMSEEGWAIVELTPGGDPDQDWGVLDLNQILD